MHIIYLPLPPCPPGRTTNDAKVINYFANDVADINSFNNASLLMGKGSGKKKREQVWSFAKPGGVSEGGEKTILLF